MKGIKTDLALAYNRLEDLKLETTSEQFIEIGQIMYDLATTQFQVGLDTGESIFNRHKKAIDLKNK